MIWNSVPKATHVSLNVLSVGIYSVIAYINNGEKAALDIMELLKIDPGYYVTMCGRSVNMRRKCSSIYRMSGLQKKWRKVLRHSKKTTTTATTKQQDK